MFYRKYVGNLKNTVTDNTVERYSFNPWGRRRNTTDFGYANVSHTFDRGYTLHEHYDGFDLINMNGRLYDPILGRMLSPDVVIQHDRSSQAYNRYSYCFNNPLRFTDPSGYVVRGMHNYYDWSSNVYYDFGNYRSNGSAFNTDLSEGFTLPSENIYTIDDNGNITLVEQTNDNYDIIYTQNDWELGNKENGFIIYDQSILSDLSQDQIDYDGSFATSNNKTDMFNLFYYFVNNSQVEWAIDGYRLSGHNEYVLRTSHSCSQVKQFSGLSKYNGFNCLFRIHSHPDQDGTMGASGYTDYTYFGDMANIAALYNVYKKAGMKNIHTWFTKDGNQIVFPKHYIYHKYSQNLYYYDPWKPNYYIRRVNQPNDLYRKLGF